MLSNEHIPPTHLSTNCKQVDAHHQQTNRFTADYRNAGYARGVGLTGIGVAPAISKPCMETSSMNIGNTNQQTAKRPAASSPCSILQSDSLTAPGEIAASNWCEIGVQSKKSLAGSSASSQTGLTIALVVAVMQLLLNVTKGMAQDVTFKVDQDVTFKCDIEGSDKGSLNVSATNIGHNKKSCRATCTVTDRGGRRQSFSFTGPVPPNDHGWFIGGKGDVPKPPLGNPTISSVSCTSMEDDS